MGSRRPRPVNVAYLEDYDENNERVDRDKRQVASTKKSKGHRESRKRKLSFSDAQYPGESSSRDAPAVEEEKPVRVEHRGSFGSDDIWSGDEMFVSSSLPSQVPVSRESLLFPHSAIMQSPEMWDPDFLGSQRSSPTLTEDPWALPQSHMMTSTTNSPLDYFPSLDSLSPRYIEDFADLVEPATYITTGDRVTRKPIGPRQSKVISDSRRIRVAGSSETSEESFSKLIGRSSLELINTARDHPLYHNVTPKADGLYHCPFEDDPKTNCTHKPEKLKCNYDKFVDSHLKPYKCKNNTCKELCFSSTACLLRHEREAHAMHGHGDKPFLCTYEGCERGVPGNGFPRHWNLRDHMKRVHNDPGHPRNETAEKTTMLAKILESKRHRTNQHEIAHENGAGQSEPGTVPITTASQGQAADMLDDGPKLSQYVRENDFQDLFTPSYLPLLDRPSRNERRSSATEDERETGLFIDDETLLPPPFYRSLKSENQPSPTASVESLQSLVDSVFSLASLSSASTAPGSDNAFQRVLAVLQADAVLKDLYVGLTARTSAVKFKRNFGILLKRFAVDLENESSCYNEQRTAKFIRSRARNIAQKIVDAVYPSGSTIERAQTSTSLAQIRADSSEDSGTEEEPDEYLELEKFVTNSRSFQKLRDNIRGFLGLELSNLFAELPFVDENTLVESEYSINSGQKALCCGKTVWSMWNFHHKIRDFLFPEPPIPNGLSRIRWKCPCGETLYDDYQELKLGAAKRMEDYLRRSSYKICAGEPKSLTERISKVWSSFKSLNTFVTQWTGTLKDNGKTTIVNTELRYYSDARTTRTPAHTSGEVFYLLLCHNSGVGAEVVKLRQPDICDINNDQKLFSFLHEEYLALRKRWWTWISLWTLQSIKFVRFELYENELVDVKKLDDVPPPTKDNEYRHGPPNPPELNPPLGSTLLMHLFKHPELAGTKKKCLQKIPRKLRNRLVVLDADDDAIGWGLQFIEGWSKKRLMYMTALTFGLSSVVVMVLVSILGHDVQNAGAIASFMLSFVTIGIATAQAAMHMN